MDLLQKLIVFRWVGCDGLDYALDEGIMDFMLCFELEFLVTKHDRFSWGRIEGLCFWEG